MLPRDAAGVTPLRSDQALSSSATEWAHGDAGELAAASIVEGLPELRDAAFGGDDTDPGRFQVRVRVRVRVCVRARVRGECSATAGEWLGLAGLAPGCDERQHRFDPRSGGHRGTRARN